VFELVVTKLPHYVLPLYPAIAILIAGAVETKVLARQVWLVRGIIWWFLVPGIVSVLAIVGAVMIGHGLALLAWPFFAGAVVCGLFAWRLYDDDGAERAFLRAAAAAVLMGFGIYGVVVPSLVPGFPAVTLAQVLKEADCDHPLAASAGYEEPSLVFLAGTTTRFTDAEGAADFMREGSCRFAFVDAKQERAFALRAEAIGLRYTRGPRIDGFNISVGKPLTIAVFQSASAQ
jgi:4-amino-4-deoxy-L-arabinose transferase-like glycosyltransferase